MKILTIGYGNMAIPFLRPQLDDNEIHVVTPNSVHGPPEIHYKKLADVKTVFDIIVFSCKPFQIDDVLKELQSDIYNKDTLFISILAATPREVFYKKLGKDAKVAIAIPNLPVKIGMGITSVLYEERIPILDKLGEIIYVKSMDDLSKLSGIFGSGTGFVYHILDGYLKAAENLDVQVNKDLQTKDLDYKALVKMLFAGAVGLSDQEKDVDFATLRQRVCSKKGTTQEGVNAMKYMEPLLDLGINAAYDRFNEVMEEKMKEI